MNSSDIRKHLRKGEQAVEALEALGYEYKEGLQKPEWVAPVNPQDALKDALEALIKTGIEEGIKARIKEDPRGPNWHLVAPMEGKNFKVRHDCIPSRHQLFKYAYGPHFAGRVFRAEEIRYHRSEEYTGYAVLFHFYVRAYRPEVVWLPLSAVAFQS